MKRGVSASVIILLPPLLFLAGCSKEYAYVTDPGKEVFNFKVTESQRQYINASRGERYEISDPLPVLDYAGKTYTIDKFQIRGGNTLNFERKGFGVNMDEKIRLYDLNGKNERKLEKFKLLALVYDYTYIENSTAAGLFREVGLWPVCDFFTEVRLNNHTQGLYHFIEDPSTYFIEQENSPFVIRRGYDHVVKAYSASPSGTRPEDYYVGRFRKIYSLLPDYSGMQLYDSLVNYMDLDQYFTKLSIDLLVKNGDYTDEIFFYSKIRDNKEIFGVFPWDYDDIFSDEPHEIGNWWATGTVFGTREYHSMDDVVADVGSKLLYSIEDDIDYKVARDDYLYQEYLKILRKVMEKIDPSVIDRVFDNTILQIEPFYSNDSIVAQSRFDENETSQSLFVSNAAEKRQMLKDRREWILGQLDIQQN
jgi:spore coat protein H